MTGTNDSTLMDLYNMSYDTPKRASPMHLPLISPLAGIDNSFSCTTCGCKTSSEFPLCFTCMIVGDDMFTRPSSSCKRRRDSVEEPRPAITDVHYGADNGTQDILNNNSLNDVFGDSFSISIDSYAGDNEKRKKRQRLSVSTNSIPLRRPSFDDILSDLTPRPLLEPFATISAPLAVPSAGIDLATSPKSWDHEFVFPTPPLRTPTASPTKHEVAGINPISLKAIPSNSPSTGLVQSAVKNNSLQAFNRKAVRSSVKPSFSKALTSKEQVMLRKAGKGAMLIRVDKALASQMADLFVM